MRIPDSRMKLLVPRIYYGSRVFDRVRILSCWGHWSGGHQQAREQSGIPVGYLATSLALEVEVHKLSSKLKSHFVSCTDTRSSLIACITV
jgi:hypothetical protein